MKTIGIMQPYFFPYLGYYQLVKAVDLFVLYDTDLYKKRSWISRNYIRSNEAIQNITLPVEAASQNRTIKSHRVVPTNLWVQKLLRQLEHAYGKTAYYKDSIVPIKNSLLRVDPDLGAYLHYSIQEIARYLDIKTDIIKASEIVEEKSLSGQLSIIDLVKRVGGTGYVNPLGGAKLYDPQLFAENGISLQFIHPYIPTTKFERPLSVIDNLMVEHRDDIYLQLDKVLFSGSKI